MTKPRTPPQPNTLPILESYTEYCGSTAAYDVAKFRAGAKKLASYGLQADQVAPLLDWCKTTWLGRNGVDLLTGLAMYWQWVDAGLPGATLDSRTPKEQRRKAILASRDEKYSGSAGIRRRIADMDAVEAEDD